MDNISTSQAIPNTSFSDQFNSQFCQSLFKYKRPPPQHISVDSGSSEASGSSDDDSSSSTGIEGPEYPPYVSNGKAEIWRNEVGKRLQQDLEIAILCNQKDEEKQLHREIAVYRNFIHLEYFEGMKEFPEATAESIRNEITKAAVDSLLLECIGDVDSFPPTQPSSSISTDLASVFCSSPPKKLRVLSKAERLAKALTAVREGSTLRQAADAYGINRQTIKNRISGKRTHAESHEDIMLLTFVEETAILRFVDQFVALGFPPRLEMLEEKAVLLLRERGDTRAPGLCWARRFLRRHPEYVSKFPRNLDQERHWNTNATVFLNWFNLFDRICRKYGIANGDVYNMDEKGYMMGVAGTTRKVMVRRNNKNAFSAHSGDRTWVTTLEFVFSRGQFFRPLIIFRGKRIQKNWIEEWSYPIYGVSDNGWTDNDAGVVWLKEIFHPAIRHFGGRRLLVIDGHKSHVSAEFIEFCWAVKIVFLCLSSHTTHYLQSLDVGCFGSLTTAYQRELEARNRTGVVQIIKVDFLHCLRKARNEAFTADNIMSAWASTGLYPFDPQQVLQQLPFYSHRATPPPSELPMSINRTPTIHDEVIAMLRTLNKYSPHYKSKLSGLTKAVKTMEADLLIARDSTRSLFKANMDKQFRKTKKSGSYTPAFGRVLTEAMATQHREDEAKKAQLSQQKQELAEARKLAVAAKKSDAAAVKEANRVARLEKRKIADEMKAMKAMKTINKKRKREEEKREKELKKMLKPKRAYGRRLRQPHDEVDANPTVVDSPAIPVDPALEAESSRARSLTPSMGGYVYPKAD